MTWQLTASLAEFEQAAGGLLRAGPVTSNLPLTVLASLRAVGPDRFGDSPPVFGWHTGAGGAADGALLQTPPYPMLLAAVPPGCAGDLVAVLGEGPGMPAAVNAATRDAQDFLAAWTAATGGTGTQRQRSRLYQLAELTPPDPPANGAARQATAADRDLLITWHEEFEAEATGAGPENAERTVDDRLSDDGLILWEDGGEPAAMAGLSRQVAGVARIAGVYTPRPLRRRGYGGAVTTAASRTARARGAAEVVLFTDLANPASNALYQRLGYRPVEDRVLIELTR